MGRLSTPIRDLSIVMLPDGKLVGHRPDCPQARQHADRGDVVMTMLDCENAYTREQWQDRLHMTWHSCLAPDPKE